MCHVSVSSFFSACCELALLGCSVFFFYQMNEFFSVACGDLTITLQPVSRQGERQNLQLSGSSETLSFTFNNVLPGKYKGEGKALFLTNSLAKIIVQL